MTTASLSPPYRTGRRDKFEIWSALLEVCAYTVRTQSWIMRKLGLNTTAAKDALETLAKGGLLTQVEKPETGRYEYRTTEKGKAALNQYYLLITKFFSMKKVKSGP